MRNVAWLTVTYADLDIIQCARITGGELKVEGGILIGGDTGQGEAAAEEADGVGEDSALDEPGGDKRECDGDVACASRDKTLGDGLANEALVGVHQIVCGGGDVIEADLLRKLGADVAVVCLVDSIKLEVDQDFAAAIDQVREREVDVGKGLFRSANNESAGALVDGQLFDVEDIADDIAELVHLFVRHAGDVDGLLQLAFEALAIFLGVFGDKYALSPQVGRRRDASCQAEYSRSAGNLSRRGRNGSPAAGRNRQTWRGCRIRQGPDG